MPRYKVSCERGAALVDAVDAWDAEEWMEKEYGEADGSYEAQEVPEDIKSLWPAFESMTVHRTDDFCCEEEGGSGVCDVRDKVLRIADEYGYGTVIDWLREGWSRRLQEEGMTREAADRAAGIEAEAADA